VAAMAKTQQTLLVALAQAEEQQRLQQQQQLVLAQRLAKQQQQQLLQLQQQLEFQQEQRQEGRGGVHLAGVGRGPEHSGSGSDHDSLSPPAAKMVVRVSGLEGESDPHIAVVVGSSGDVPPPVMSSKGGAVVALVNGDDGSSDGDGCGGDTMAQWDDTGGSSTLRRDYEEDPALQAPDMG